MSRKEIALQIVLEVEGRKTQLVPRRYCHGTTLSHMTLIASVLLEGDIEDTLHEIRRGEAS